MDFLDPNKKRAHTIRLFIGYILVAIAIAFGALILLFQSYGYDLDRRTGQVIQNGLVFVSAKPESTEIYLNGTQNKSRTDTRLTIPAGQYVVELKRSGYRDWRRVINLEGGSIERLTYPLLFPEKLTTDDTQLYGGLPSFATQSPNRTWLLIQQPGSLTTFDNFDLGQADPAPTTLTLPADLLTAATGDHQLVLVEWADDNRHILLRHNYAGTFEFVLIDRERPGESINLTRRLGTGFNDITLHDKDANQLYIFNQAAQALQTYDVRAQETRALLQGVLAYKSRGDKFVLYQTTDPSVPTRRIFKLWDGGASFDIKTFDITTEYFFDLVKYDGNWLVAIGPKSDSHIYIYENPIEELKNNQKVLVPLSILKLDQLANLAFSASGQFLMTQSGSKFGVYDGDTDRRFYYDLKSPAIDIGQKAAWMDEHRLTLTIDNKVEVFDFDGSNQQTLTATTIGFLPYFNQDYTNLYNVAPSVVVPGRYALTRTDLRAK